MPADQRLFREKLHAWLEDGEGRPGKMIAFAIACLVMISVLSLPFELLSAFAEYHRALFWLEVVIVGIFTVEYALRIYAAPRWWRYVFSWHGLIDFLAIAPFYLALVLLGLHVDARILRFFRLARLARIFKIANSEALRKRAHEQEILPEEELLYIAQHHPIIFIINLVPVLFSISIGLLLYIIAPATWTGFVLLSLAGLSGVLFLKAWFDYSHDIVYVTNLRIIISHRQLFGRESHELYHADVVDVRTFHPHVFAYLFGYGSLVIETSAGTRSITLERMSEHEKIRGFIDRHRGIVAR